LLLVLVALVALVELRLEQMVIHHRLLVFLQKAVAVVELLLLQPQVTPAQMVMVVAALEFQMVKHQH
jgi:hypothetical protein